MRSRYFFLFFPLAIFLMVAASVAIVFMMRPGVREDAGAAAAYGVSVDTSGPGAPNFKVSAGKGFPPAEEAVAGLADPGVVKVGESWVLEGAEGAIEIDYEATLEFGDVAGLENWLNFESQTASLLWKGDRAWLAEALPLEPGAEAELMAEAILRWSEAQREGAMEVRNAPQWLQEDLRVLIRFALREILEAESPDPGPAEIERLLVDRFPPGSVQFRVYSAEAVPQEAGERDESLIPVQDSL